MKLKALATVVVCIVVLLAAFLWLDFRLMSSRMASDSSVAASQRPTGASPTVAVTGLNVPGNERMQRALQSRLDRELDSLPGIGDAKAAANRTAEPGSALIAVSFVERQVFWTPFYARSQMHVHVAYASNGDVSFDDGSEVTRFSGSSGEPPVVQFLASYALADVSWGLVSQAGYEDYLAEQIAQKVKATIQEQMRSV